MDYVDLLLGDFLDRVVQMSDVVVYDTTYNDTLLFRTRIGGLPNYEIKDSSIPDGMSLNDYGIIYVSSTSQGLEIGVVEV